MTEELEKDLRKIKMKYGAKTGLKAIEFSTDTDFGDKAEQLSQIVMSTCKAREVIALSIGMIATTIDQIDNTEAKKEVLNAIHEKIDYSVANYERL